MGHNTHQSEKTILNSHLLKRRFTINANTTFKTDSTESYTQVTIITF